LAAQTHDFADHEDRGATNLDFAGGDAAESGFRDPLVLGRSTLDKCDMFVVLASVLSLLGHVEPQPTAVGIAVLVVAAIAMPWLASQKRRLSATTGSGALRADAAESAVCGYLALIALAGLVVNSIWGFRWADSLAALALLPVIVREGWEAMKGKPCCGAG
jgi:hypothetical protein